MIALPIDQITSTALEALVQNRAPESRTLEFKVALPARDNQGRHEFLADVSALGNVAGGDIVFGMAEDDDGAATAIVPIPCNPDEECLRLQDVIANGLEPKLSGVHVVAVNVGQDVYNFVARIPQSWNGPHRVKTNQHFYAREGRRKRQLEMPEIRSAILRSEAPGQLIQNFRSDRLGKILGKQTPVPLFEGAIEVLHVIPMQTALGGANIDVLQYFSTRALPVISATHTGERRLNLDGVLHSRNVVEAGCGAYTQLFRNGFIESVRVFTTVLDTGRFNLGSQAFEVELITYFDRMKAELTHMQLSGPVLMLWSLIYADKAQIGMDAWTRAHLDGQQGLFDRQVIALPDVLIAEGTEPARALKPMFDLVWNSAGMPGSINYDSDGNWRQPRF